MKHQFSTALSFAADAHDGQKDRAGVPYIYHVLEVINIIRTQMTRFYADNELDEILSIAALHDVLEDTEYIEEDLDSIWLSSSVIDNVVLLTKTEDVEYSEYISGISKSRYASIVKVADLMHNMQVHRLSNILKDKDLERLNKYRSAYTKLLNNLILEMNVNEHD